MPTIDYQAQLRLLVAVRGHPFDRNAFAAMFDSMSGIAATFVDQPAAALMMGPETIESFDALLLYDMPGIDFVSDGGRPLAVDPGDRFRQRFTAMLDSGIGIVAMHHALAGWPAWPEYAHAIGGHFLYRPGTLRGQEKPDSGYRHGVDYEAVVEAPDHPVLSAIPPSFRLVDELYLAEVFEDEVTPLLRARYDFVRDNFYSAAAAVEGRMFSKDGWIHEDGSNLIGWVKRANKSPLVYLQPGDDKMTYDNQVYRRLVENAVRWVASPEAQAWSKA
jgi:type 1 glutamine amidotransferase